MSIDPILLGQQEMYKKKQEQLLNLLGAVGSVPQRRELPGNPMDFRSRLGDNLTGDTLNNGVGFAPNPSGTNQHPSVSEAAKMRMSPVVDYRELAKKALKMRKKK